MHALNNDYLTQKLLLTINLSMKKRLFIYLFGVISTFTMYAQQTLVKGSVTEAISFEPIPEVTVTIEGTELSVVTGEEGTFEFLETVPLGEQILVISKSGYISKRYPIVVNAGQTVNITDMTLEKVVTEADLFTITLSDDELNDDDSGFDNVSGLLQSSQDVYQRTAAFEFSSSFYRVRGLDSDNGSVLINGIEMNKLYNGRPQWSDWGGLNDVLRNQELTTGLQPSNYNFGGVLGTTNMTVRASKYREGGRVTYSTSNRSYTNRIMASYASGLLKGGWSYAIMAGRRWGDEGYQEATLYDSNSFFASVEKQLGEKHSLNFTSIYTPNRRGKSSPNTQEVYDLKGIKYNEYWGWYDGEKKNSRIKEIEEPIFMLNHYWDISSKTKLNTNIGYQFGKIGNSRLDYGGGSNPSPAYYQNLPSYALGDPNGPDFESAYIKEQRFLNDGQVDWQRIIDANITNASQGIPNAYVLYEDRNDDKQLTVNSILTSEITENIILNASVNYKKLKSENFAEVIDLLGGNSYLDSDSFALTPDSAPNDLNNPNRLVGEGDQFKYNYNLFADVISGHAQAQFKYSKVDFYFAGSYTNTTYQREGLYLNGRHPENSFGKGDKLDFNGFGGKGGITYKFSGKHLLDFNAGYIQRAPFLRNVYTNSRENHDYVGVVNGQQLGNITLEEEKITSADVSYIFRSPIVKARVTGYYTKMEDANEISFFFTQGGSGTGFLQEVLAGVDKKNIGVEFGIEAQVLPTFKLKAAGNFGQYTYDNNPELYLTSSSEDFVNDESLDLVQDNILGKSNLKDYKVAGGPQQAYSFGFEYNDPDYWWFGATVNYFANTYIDISPLARSERFYLDNDGLPFNDYDESVARELLKQEEFDDYFTVNLTGGKSWKIGDYYIGLFASVNNLLDEVYKTGGYEQGRRSDFRTLRDDVNSPKRVFGSKYWYGRGATYFVNLNFRF